MSGRCWEHCSRRIESRHRFLTDLTLYGMGIEIVGVKERWLVGGLEAASMTSTV